MLLTRRASCHFHFWSLAAFALVCNATVADEIAGVLHLTNGYGSNNTPTGRTTAPVASTGTGYAFAESCQAALFSWSDASSNYGLSHNSTSTSYFTSEMTIKSNLPGTTEINKLITLCDGHARVVGRTTATEGAVVTKDETWTNTNPSVVVTGFPTPLPCSINPEDCNLLQSSWSSQWNALKTKPVGGLRDPPCTTSTTSFSYSTNSEGGSCDNCLVIGSEIRLLYWPVITEAGSDNLCKGSALTLTTAPTGSGPNTFVTAGVTITSPSVAVSIGGLSRVDNCGTTVDHTIIPVLPKDVSSVEGARALFTHRPFNFANLNYRCLNDPESIYFTTGTRNDCYQEVPASAYFRGANIAGGLAWWGSGAFNGSTIWPNYAPQVLPPETLTKAIRSLWGNDCYIHPDGVWDPPIALGKETDLPAPEAHCTSITYLMPTSTPAVPAPTVPHVSPTKPQHTAPQQTSKPGIIVPTITTSSITSGHGSPGDESIVQKTALTIGNNPGDGEFTVVHVAGGLAMVNDFTTIALDPKAADGGPSEALTQASPAHAAGQIVNLSSGQYTVEQIQGGGMRVVGASTTIKINDDSATTTAKAKSQVTNQQDPTGASTATAETGTRPQTANEPSPSSGTGSTLLSWTSWSLLLVGAFVVAL